MSGNFAIKGGGAGRLMANAILNFHFDFPHPSLIELKNKNKALGMNSIFLWYHRHVNYYQTFFSKQSSSRHFNMTSFFSSTNGPRKNRMARGVTKYSIMSRTSSLKTATFALDCNHKYRKRKDMNDYSHYFFPQTNQD